MTDITNFGVLMPTRGVLVYANGGRPRVELNWQMAETAERAGYGSVWVGDSITSKPRREPRTTMAATAARPRRAQTGRAGGLPGWDPLRTPGPARLAATEPGPPWAGSTKPLIDPLITAAPMAEGH